MAIHRDGRDHFPVALLEGGIRMECVMFHIPKPLAVGCGTLHFQLGWRKYVYQGEEFDFVSIYVYCYNKRGEDLRNYRPAQNNSPTVAVCASPHDHEEGNGGEEEIAEHDSLVDVDMADSDFCGGAYLRWLMFGGP